MSWLERFFSTVVVACVLVVGVIVAPVGFGIWNAEQAEAADLSKFDAGNIISDQVFYNSAAMSEKQISDFIEKKVPTCRSGYTCLDQYREETHPRAADSYCKAVSGGSNDSAARIIYKVSVACGINPQVLLVTLQKEQGLLTHEWPSDWRYTIAMGYGCPDGAPCEEKYFGFQNQLYLAARQFQIYKAWPNSFRYRAGQNNEIQWHPNKACGTSTVYIENQATAGLYNYTPYRPNKAALNAGYGTGDGCSSYGNRNFYNYFTDWFGSTHKIGWLVKSPSGPEVYFVAGQTKHHIQTQYDYREYRRTFGGLSAVSDGYLRSLKTGAPATAIVKNPANGDIMLLQNSTFHRFPSCSLAEVWGYSCAMDINFTSEQIAAVDRGSDMTNYARIESSSAVVKITGTKMYPYASEEDAAYFNGGEAKFAAIMREGIASRYSVVGKIRFAPATLGKTGSDKNVYFMGGDFKKWRLPSWAVARDFGISGGYTPTSAVALKGYASSGDLSLFVRCDGKLYLANSGHLTHVKSGDSYGMPSVVLDRESCARIPKSGSFSGKVFLRAHGQAEVYLLESGELRHVVSERALVQLNGGKRPTIALVEKGSLAEFAGGQPILGPGTLVKAEGTRDVYFVDGRTRLFHLPSWNLAHEYGLPAGYDSVTSKALAPYKNVGKLSQFVQCNGKLFIAGDGALYQVETGNSAGFSVIEMQAETCNSFDSAGSISSRIFVRVPNAPEVYLLENEKARHVVSKSALLALNGGSMPKLVPVSSETLAGYTSGFPVLEPGSLVKESSSPIVFLVNGKQKIRLPSWGLAADFGFEERYTSTGDKATAGYPRSEADLSPFIQCNGTTYVAAGGKFSEVTAAFGMEVSSLDSSLCQSLDLSGTKVAKRVFVKSSSADDLYVVEDGAFRPVKDLQAARQLNGGVDVVVLTMDPRTVAAFSA